MPSKHRHPSTKSLLLPNEAAAYLGIGRTKLYALLGARKLPSRFVLNRRYLAKEDLDQYTAQLEAAAQTPVLGLPSSV